MELLMLNYLLTYDAFVVLLTVTSIVNQDKGT